MPITKHYLEFSRPFIEALKETFEVMMSSSIKGKSPRIKTDQLTSAEITSVIGMNGSVDRDGEKKSFRGQIGVSFSKPVFLKVASAMLMEEFTEYNEDIADTGAEIVNIVMGNAKKALAKSGYEIGMATPTTIIGKEVEIKYPKSTTVVETTIESEFGEFVFEICYLEG